MTWVQPMNASTSSAVTGATRARPWPARTRTAPSVFIAMKVPPCIRQMKTSVIPARIGYGWNRSQKLPAYSWCELIGVP